MPDPNSYPSQYMTIHHEDYINYMIRKNQTCIRKRYTIDHFLKYYHIHEQTSPSISVK